MTWIGLLFLAVVLSSLTYITIVHYILDLRSNADVLTTFVRYFFGKHFRVFTVARIQVFPLLIEDLEVVLRATKLQPEGAVSWRCLRLCVDRSRLHEPLVSLWLALSRSLSRLFPFSLFRRTRTRTQTHTGTPGASNKCPAEHYHYSPAIVLEIEGFSCSSPDAQFKHVLEVSPRKQPPRRDETESHKLQQSLFMYLCMSVAQHFIGLFSVRILGFSTEVTFQTLSHTHTVSHTSTILASAEKMEILPRRSRNLQSEGFTMLVILRDGAMEILHDSRRAFFFAGQGARLAVDYLLANGHMDVMARLYGRENDAEVHTQPFLAFYRVYNTAEDDALELRIARGFPTYSKMSMGAHCEFIKIGVYDERVPGPPMIIEIEDLSGSLASFRMTTSGRRTHKNKLCIVSPQDTPSSSSKDTPQPPPVMGRRSSMSAQDTLTPRTRRTSTVASEGFFREQEKEKDKGNAQNKDSTSSSPILHSLSPQDFPEINEFPFLPAAQSPQESFSLSPHVEKVMTAAVRTVSLFLAQSPAGERVFRECSFHKVLKVRRTAPFIDEDRVHASAESVSLEGIDARWLDWLSALQDTSNRLPSSRFAHQKDAHMYATLEALTFSAQPLSLRYNEEDLKRTLRGVRSARDLPLPQTKIDLDRHVTFHVTQMSVRKTFLCRERRSSLYAGELALLEIETEMRSREIERQFAVCSLSETMRRAQRREREKERDRGREKKRRLTQRRVRERVLDRLLELDKRYFRDSDSDEENEQKNNSRNNSIDNSEEDALLGSRSFWRFEQLSFSVWMGEGEKMQIETVRCRSLIVDLAHCSPPLPVSSPFCTPAQRHTRQKESLSAEDWRQIMRERRKERASSFDHSISLSLSPSISLSASHTPSAPSCPARYLFLSMSHIHAQYTGDSVSVTVSPIHCNVSPASMLRFLASYDAIKRTADRVSLRMELLKLTGSEESLPFIERERDPDAVTALRVGDCTLVFSLSPPALPDTKKEKEIESTQTTASPRFAVIKLRQMVYEKSRRRQVCGAEEMEVGLDSFSQTSLLSMRNARYEKDCDLDVETDRDESKEREEGGSSRRDGNKGSEKEDERQQSVSEKHEVKDKESIECVAVKETVYAENISVQMHSLMEAGVAAELLLLQDAALRSALSRAQDREREREKEREHFIYDLDALQLHSQSQSQGEGGSFSPLLETDFDYSVAFAEDDSLSPFRTLPRSLSEEKEREKEKEKVTRSPSILMREERERQRERACKSVFHVNIVRLCFAFDDALPLSSSQTVSASPLPSLSVDRSPAVLQIELLGLDSRVTSSLSISPALSPSLSSQEDVQDEISLLDLGPERLLRDSDYNKSNNSNNNKESVARDALDNFVSYDNVKGGALSMSLKQLRVSLSSQEAPLLQLFFLSAEGPLYAATVKDDRVPREERLSALAETVLVDATASQGPKARESEYDEEIEREDEKEEDEEEDLEETDAEREGEGDIEIFRRRKAQREQRQQQQAQRERERKEREVRREQRRREREIALLRLYCVATQCDPFFSLVSRSTAPAKLYCDLCVKADHLLLFNGGGVAQSLSQAAQIISKCIPPNRDPSPPLPAWDSLRFFVHGECSLLLQRISLSHCTPGMMEKITVSLEMQVPQLHVEAESVEFTCDALEITAEIESLVLTGRARSNIKRKLVTRKHTLVHVPSMVVAMRHALHDCTNDHKNSSMRVYNHHDVYLHPAYDPLSLAHALSPSSVSRSSAGRKERERTRGKVRDEEKEIARDSKTDESERERDRETESEMEKKEGDEAVRIFLRDVPLLGARFLQDDRFFFFRSRPLTVKWDVEMRFADDRERPISLDLRLDVLMRVLTALSSNEQGEGSEGEGEGATQNIIAPPSSSANAQNTQNPQNNVSLLSLVNQLDLQCVLNKIVISSWCSAKQRDGIAIVQQLTDVQLRMVRAGLEPANSSTGFASVRTTSLFSQPLPAWKSKDAQSERVREQSRLLSRSLLRSETSLPFRLFRVHYDMLFPSASTSANASTNASVPLAIAVQVLPPLTVAHLFVDMFFTDLFVRDWTLLSSALSNSNADSLSSFAAAAAAVAAENEQTQKRKSRFFTSLQEDTLPNNSTHSAQSTETTAGPKTSSFFYPRGSMTFAPPTPSSAASSAPVPPTPQTKSLHERLRKEEEQEALQPQSAQQLQSLMQPLFKLAHASKVVVSLSPNGTVANRVDNFRSSGVLDRREERERELERERQKERDTLREGMSSRAREKDREKQSEQERERERERERQRSRQSSFMIGKELRRQTSGEEAQLRARETLSSLRHSHLLRKRQESLSRALSLQDRGARLLSLSRSNSPSLPVSQAQPFPQPQARSTQRVSFAKDPSLVVTLSPSLAQARQSKRRTTILSPSRAMSDNDDSERETEGVRDREREDRRRGRERNKQRGSEYRAALSSFQANHAAFTPPQDALPQSYRGERRGSVSCSLLLLRSSREKDKEKDSEKSKEGENDSLPSLSPSFASSSSFSSPSPRATRSAASLGGNIWGLKVVDVRILFTISIRDCLFIYVSRCIDLFSSNGEEDEERLARTEGERDTGGGALVTPMKDAHAQGQGQGQGAQAKRRSSVAELIGAQQRRDSAVELSDFHSVCPELAEPSPSTKSRKKNLRVSTRKNSTTTSSATVSGSDSAKNTTPLERDRERAYSQDASSVTRHLGIITSPLSPSPTPSIASSPAETPLSPLPHGGDNNNEAASPIPPPPITSPFSSPRKTLSGASPVPGSVSFGADSASSPGAARLTKRSNAMRRGSLFNRSIEVRAEISSSHNPSSTASAAAITDSGSSAGVNTSDRRSSSSAGATKTTGVGKNTSSAQVQSTPPMPLTQTAFEVEIIDPQINFLDDQTHSSLIIVAGSSRLSGTKSNVALALDKRGKEFKRKHELRLQMDGVSAFTVPTLSSSASSSPAPSTGIGAAWLSDMEETDEVHWKHLKSTTDAMTVVQERDGDRDRDRDRERDPSRSRVDRLLGDYGKVLLSAARSGERAESPLLAEAIKDFQIRCLYTFWTEVSLAEAKEMHVAPIRKKRAGGPSGGDGDEEDFVCTFRLELPDLLVDIYAWQFYAILNVMRNVLLVPPPLLDSSKRRQAAQEDGENEKTKVLELQRNPALFESAGRARYSLLQPLDITRTASREELKMLIENSLDTALQLDLQSQVTARFVEVFIGKMTWRLRNAAPSSSTSAAAQNAQQSSSSGSSFPSIPLMMSSKEKEKEREREREKEKNEHELLEVALFGVYSTLDFNENRCITSLFEIQRFWAKNMNPGGDSSIFEDKTCVLIPQLNQQDYCVRCGTEFDIDTNHSRSCTFHADQDGNPGEFREVMIVDELSQQEARVKMWSCCGRTSEKAAGCSARPHSCKDVMLSLRAETNPTTRVENVDVSVLKTIEISIFPGASYDLRLQLTRSLADLLHRYFSIDNAFDSIDAAALSGKKDGATNAEDDAEESDAEEGAERERGNSSDEMDLEQELESSLNGIAMDKKKNKTSMLSALFHRSKDKDKEKEKDKKKDIKRAQSEDAENERSSDELALTTRGSRGSLSLSHAEAPNMGSSSTRSRRRQVRFSTTESSSTAVSAERERERTTTASSSSSAALVVSTSGAANGNTVVKKQRQEGVYIRYMRVGDINLDVSTAGFRINLDRFKVVMEPYFCRREVLEWKRLIWSMERHLVWSLTKHTASSSMNKFAKYLGMRSSPAVNAHAGSTPGIMHKILHTLPKGGKDDAAAMKKSILLGSPQPRGSTLSLGNASQRLRNSLIIFPAIATPTSQSLDSVESSFSASVSIHSHADSLSGKQEGTKNAASKKAKDREQEKSDAKAVLFASPASVRNGDDKNAESKESIEEEREKAQKRLAFLGGKKK